MATTSGISFSGLGSGIDTESIITQLMALERVPINRLKQRQQELSARMSVMSGLSGKVVAFSTASAGLRQVSAFQNYSVQSSSSDVAKASVSAGAVAGTFSLRIDQLAQVHKVATTAQSSANDPLGLGPGTMVVNGRGIQVGNQDSLATLAAKINEASAGVVATVIDGGPGNAYLTLTSTTSGQAGAIQVADLTGSTAMRLGLVSDAFDSMNLAQGLTSFGFSSASETVGELLGAANVGTRRVYLNGKAIDLDLGTMSLDDLALKINEANVGISASVRTDTSDGTTRYHLDLKGVTAFNDPVSVLSALGLVRLAFQDTIAEAQDAHFSIDGIQLSTSTNRVDNVIGGLSIDLLKTGSTTLDVTSDTATTKSRIQAFVDAYNNLVGYIRENSRFNTETFESGALLGDSTSQQIEADMATMILSDVSVAGSPFRNLTQIGFGLDSTGNLTLDDVALDKALAQSPQSVASLFLGKASTSSNLLTFIASSSSTVPSGPAGYPVHVTELGSGASVRGSYVVGSQTRESETLTFSGPLFGNQTIDLLLEAGQSLPQIVERITNDSRLQGLVEVTTDGGFLGFRSKTVGTPGDFTVTSDRPATSTNTGIGSPWNSAPVAQTQPLFRREQLSFSTDPAGSGFISIELSAGMSLSEVTSVINADSRLSAFTTASVRNGKLTFEPKTVGIRGMFRVWSDVEAASDSTGVGRSGFLVRPKPEVVEGSNIVGTIGGESATGYGTLLTGNSGNARTAGLKIEYGGSTTGDVGTVFLSKGIAASMNDLMLAFTEGSTGPLSVSTNLLREQSEAIDTQIAEIEERIAVKESTLRLRFSKMEETMAALTAQQGQLSALLTSWTKSD